MYFDLSATPYVLIAIIVIFSIWKFFFDRRNHVKIIPGQGKAEKQMYEAILKEFAKLPRDLKVSQVKELLDAAEERNCLKSFKTWLLKQDISDGVRTKIEILYAMQSQKLQKRAGG